MNWIVLKTHPNIISRHGPPPETDIPSRVEFHVLWRLTQNEHPAMLPYETVYVKRQGKRRPTPIKMALYPRYVFAALGDVLTDYCRLRAAIPEIQGIVSESPDMWSPLVLSPSQVQLVTNAVAKTAKATEVDIHKSLRVGKQVEVSVGGIPQETRIDLITKTGIKALVDMFGGKHLVEFAFDKVRAA